MIKHTITIVFGASERLDIERVLSALGNRVIDAHSVGIEIDHQQEWIDEHSQRYHYDPLTRSYTR